MNVEFKNNADHNSQRVQDLLNTVCSLTTQIRLQGEGNGVMDENVKQSLESTIIRACNRLDIILDEPSRWTPPTQDLQELVAAKLAADNKLQEYSLFGAEMQKQEILKNLAKGAPAFSEATDVEATPENPPQQDTQQQ